MQTEVIAVLDNIRSAHNVGSILRSAAAFGVAKVICCGITPYPQQPDDQRLPHVIKKANERIAKAAVGGEILVALSHAKTTQQAITELIAQQYSIVALEQTLTAMPLADFQLPDKCVVILGNEVEGVTADLLEQVEVAIEIPLPGTKQSLNVSVAAAIAFYHFAQPAVKA